MNRRAAWLGAASIAIAVVGVLAAGVAPLCGCTPPRPSDVASPVDGVVISVDAASLTDIRGFSLRTSAGQTLHFKLGALENATEFSPSHLKEHQANSEPIRVWFRVESGDRVAYRIEDAPG